MNKLKLSIISKINDIIEKDAFSELQIVKTRFNDEYLAVYISSQSQT